MTERFNFYALTQPNLDRDLVTDDELLADAKHLSDSVVGAVETVAQFAKLADEKLELIMYMPRGELRVLDPDRRVGLHGRDADDPH